MPIKTADLYDKLGKQLQVAAPIFRHFGARASFAGPISTVKVFEDNPLVRSALEEKGAGRVLVVDGGGSMRCALVGDQIAQLAVDNGWAGLVIYGCIRDSLEINSLDIGIKALTTNPAKSAKHGEGERDIPVSFADVTFRPGEYLTADEDGIVVSTTQPIP